MSISTRVAAYLDNQGIEYDTINHIHTSTAAGSATTAHVPLKSVAKAVVLEDHDSHHLMAILPADQKLSLHKLNRQMNAELHLVDEENVYQLFEDCDPGAVPAIGKAYNMNAIYDESLDQLEDIYLEAGDHETLIHLNKRQFGKLMANTKQGQFGSQNYY